LPSRDLTVQSWAAMFSCLTMTSLAPAGGESLWLAYAPVNPRAHVSDARESRPKVLVGLY
jgi:hypothetical protein